METVVRFLPMFVSGFLCNLVQVAANIPLVWLLGMLFFYLQKFLYSLDISLVSAAGTTATTISCLLFAIIDPLTTLTPSFPFRMNGVYLPLYSTR